MTGEQILRGMTMIDEVFILEAAPRTEQKRRRGAKGWLGYAAAACLGLLVCGSLLWQMVKPVPAKAFEIEDGVLLAYHGTDAEVVIPDEVTKISASAFATAPSPDSITSLYIGANVAEIESDALAPLTELDTITVAEENEFFEVVDGVLARKDGTLAVDDQRPYADSKEALYEVLRQIDTGETYLGENLTIMYKQTEVFVNVREATPATLAVGGRPYNCVMTAVKFAGIYLELERPVPLAGGNGQWDLFQRDDMLLLVAKGQIYLLANGQVTDISNPDTYPDGYNESIYFYSEDGEGNIIYTRQPSKYVYDNETIFDLLFCAGADELFREEGIVTWDGENLGYVPTATYTVGEVWDLEQKFEELKKSMAYFNSTFGYPPCETVEELLEHNREHYGRAE